MEKQFMGIVASKISGVYLRGLAQVSCRIGSFQFVDEDGSPDGSAHVSWRDSSGHHRVLADEVIGVVWSEE